MSAKHTLSYDCSCMIEALQGTITETAYSLTGAAAKRWATVHVTPFVRHRFVPVCSCGWNGREKFQIEGAVELGRWHKRNVGGTQ